MVRDGWGVWDRGRWDGARVKKDGERKGWEKGEVGGERVRRGNGERSRWDGEK